ncbi:MAG TPA: alpha/beta fold hydrolase, partial [Gaiellaceae bacterium]|nr:alpha/beta fold hydrolase [Gaiellaceae bacterium]
MREGTVAFPLDGEEAQTWYRVSGELQHGDDDPAPLVVLHGGPGATHDYLLPLRDLARSGWSVVFYDQLGCGRSELPKNYGLFTVERAVEEVEAFRAAMGL